MIFKKLILITKEVISGRYPVGCVILRNKKTIEKISGELISNRMPTRRKFDNHGKYLVDIWKISDRHMMKLLTALANMYVMSKK